MEGARGNNTSDTEPEDPTENQQPGNEGGGGPEGTAWGWRDLAVGAAVGTAAVTAAPVILSAAGFTAGGIAAGSFAASAQSVFYGPSVASGSVLAVLQSAGSAGIGTTASTVIAGATGTTAVFLRRIGQRWWSSGGN